MMMSFVSVNQFVGFLEEVTSKPFGVDIMTTPLDEKETVLIPFVDVILDRNNLGRRMFGVVKRKRFKIVGRAKVRWAEVTVVCSRRRAHRTLYRTQERIELISEESANQERMYLGLVEGIASGNDPGGIVVVGSISFGVAWVLVR